MERIQSNPAVKRNGSGTGFEEIPPSEGLVPVVGLEPTRGLTLPGF
jgi:hypothetical protein